MWSLLLSSVSLVLSFISTPVFSSINPSCSHFLISSRGIYFSLCQVRAVISSCFFAIRVLVWFSCSSLVLFSHFFWCSGPSVLFVTVFNKSSLVCLNLQLLNLHFGSFSFYSATRDNIRAFSFMTCQNMSIRILAESLLLSLCI